MSEKTGVHDEAIKGLVEQYKENLRMLFREGKLSHRSLEEQLSYVVDSVNEEIRKITAEVITEEDGGKKTAGAPCVNAKRRSTKKRRK
jgi:hypothetical protein